jgi:hypothetical protein
MTVEEISTAYWAKLTFYPLPLLKSFQVVTENIAEVVVYGSNIDPTYLITPCCGT